MKPSTQEIWTIGHSTRDFTDFVAMLQSFQIEILADVRSYPGSRKFPQFNKESLQQTLPENGIKYVHLGKLGGRRKVKEDSHNTAWRHPAFRGYADYMETDHFREGMKELKALAIKNSVAYMCSEAVWWRCHRSLISDFLKAEGWNVWHIMDTGVVKEHPYTSPAKIKNGRLDYSA